jgi:hypothetical protein
MSKYLWVECSNELETTLCVDCLQKRRFMYIHCAQKSKGLADECEVNRHNIRITRIMPCRFPGLQSPDEDAATKTTIVVGRCLAESIAYNKSRAPAHCEMMFEVASPINSIEPHHTQIITWHNISPTPVSRQSVNIVFSN